MDLKNCLIKPEEGDFPENLHRVVYVIINKRLKKKNSSTSLVLLNLFGCLDLVLER